MGDGIAGSEGSGNEEVGSETTNNSVMRKMNMLFEKGSNEHQYSTSVRNDWRR